MSQDINNHIVNDIYATGGKAVGLAGHQEGLISAEKLQMLVKDSDSNIEKLLDLGYVGKPTNIHLSLYLSVS